MTRKTFQKWGVKGYQEIFFPNTIEEDIHHSLNKVPSKLKKIDKPVMLIVARLHEKYKGINQFFEFVIQSTIRES